MDPEQTFIRVQERFSQMLTPRIRSSLEYIYLFMAVALFCILVVLHANYVQQPGCSSEIFRADISEAQLIQIQITTGNNEKTVMTENVKAPNIDDTGLLAFTKKFQSNLIPLNGWSGTLKSLWKTCKEIHSYSLGGTNTVPDKTNSKIIHEDRLNSFFLLMKTSCKCSVVGFIGKWYGRLLSFWRFSTQMFSELKTFWNITGGRLKRVVPKCFHVILENSGSLAVQWLEKRRKVFEPTYLYTLEKGYFLVPEAARPRHNIHTVNISISPQNTCFGNRWQQLLINRCVGYDTILINSLLNSPGQGYLYNFQTREFYNLSYAPTGSATLGDYFVTKCGVLMMSLFVFFTTTISVSFTLRETQTRMLRFTVQLQHHARHRLPTFQLIFVHVVESLVFVPIMIGILFFLFEFYDDQLLAFMVLIVVWLCEVFTLISVRTPISMKFFPRFFLLYFLGFHIYFFSYGYGFSYLALSTTAAFMQHLILYFWNRFEVPALEMFMQNRGAEAIRQHEDIRITSSTILASTLHITRVNSRSVGELAGHGSTEGVVDGRAMNSFSSLLLWILGGASSESLTSFLSLFRYVTDQGEAFPQQQNDTDQSVTG